MKVYQTVRASPARDAISQGSLQLKFCVRFYREQGSLPQEREVTP